MDANDREDYAAALREWGPPAEQGDALAQINLGVLYRKGEACRSSVSAGAVDAIMVNAG
jgi:TPR repeat protein